MKKIVFLLGLLVSLLLVFFPFSGVSAIGCSTVSMLRMSEVIPAFNYSKMCETGYIPENIDIISQAELLNPTIDIKKITGSYKCVDALAEYMCSKEVYWDRNILEFIPESSYNPHVSIITIPFVNSDHIAFENTPVSVSGFSTNDDRFLIPSGWNIGDVYRSHSIIPSSYLNNSGRALLIIRDIENLDPQCDPITITIKANAYRLSDVPYDIPSITGYFLNPSASVTLYFDGSDCSTVEVIDEPATGENEELRETGTYILPNSDMNLDTEYLGIFFYKDGGFYVDVSGFSFLIIRFLLIFTSIWVFLILIRKYVK